jgi:hypothetical protein
MMRSAPVLAAVSLGAVAVISGCGQQYTGTPAGPPLAGASSPAPAGAPSPLPAGASSPPPASSPSPPPPPGTCHGGPVPRLGVITLTNADNGRSVCVRRGTAVQVYLRGTRASRWSAIHASSGVLQPHANGHLLLALGVTGGSFIAAHPGTASITSTRLVCPTPPPNSGSESGTVECGVILGFRVSVRVS